MAGAPLSRLRRRVADLGAPMVGGRAYAYMPDSLAVGPEGALVVTLSPEDTVIERATLAGTYLYRLTVRVVVGAASAEEAQRQLDERIDPDGARSVWSALETEGGVDGLADYLIVTGAENYGEWREGEARYLSADLRIEAVSNR